ncbi:MAG: zinc metallopeptidase [Chloroflexi bacterium]|nr:zinc metallopeptidase [Chloroflexota bacterium]
MILMGIAQWRVQAAYKKWSKVPNQMGLSGVQAAQRLISQAGLFGVRVEGTPGKLSDNYDPRDKVLHLSQGIGNGASVASLAVVAHEIGHAMQDNEDYVPLRFRAAIVPAVNIGSYLGWILIIIGLLLNYVQIAWLGVLVFSLGVVFALVTLPVEFNASHRALGLLTNSGMITTPEEKKGVRSVLDAAAMTYVAALATAVFQLLYYVLLVTGMGGRRRS